MAERDRASFLALIYLVCLVAQAVSNPVNIPLGRVPPRLLGKAWRALNEHSPTHHLYAHGNLINAQELEEPPYKVYKFTYDLSPICGTESCPREACTIDLKQDEHGDIETLNDSIQCMYFYPADAQNDMSQEQQSYQEQEDSQVTQENLAEQVNNNRSVELDHEIQETGDENVRTFVAVRANNYCPGCPYELNPNLPGLLPFVEQALKLMDEQTANDYKHKLMSIVRVTRSVPVSSNVIEYQLLLQIGESECLKNALEQEQECPLRTTVPTKLCLVTFEQRPWQQTSLRVVKNNCTDPENTSSANSQTQRSLESESLVTVKYDEGRFATEKFAAYEGLKEMLDNYTHAPSVPSKEPEEVAMTESAIVKIVLNKSQDDEETLGFMNKTKDYREFLEDFDLPVEDATVETAGPLKEVKEDKFQRKKVEDFKLEKANNKEDVNRKKRSQRLFGAPEPIPVDHPDIQLYVNKTLQKISAESNEPNEPFIEIIEASVQVVSGQLYKIKAKLGTSDCPKGTISNCQLQAGSEMKECLIKIWSQPWVDKGSPEITVECPSSENNRKKRSPPLVGAPATIPVDHPDVQLYVNKAQQKISAESNEPNEPYIEIIEASVQVVAGQLYKIKAKLGTSDCPKGTTSNCQLQAGSEMKECLIKVWSRPWLDNGSPEITVECSSSENNRKKRSPPLVGAPATIPVDHPDVQLYVNKAQQKISAESNEPNEPYIEIIEASVQVVAGQLYKIKAKLGTSDCPKGTTSNCQLQAGSEMKECLIKVWSRPWLDNGSPEITVECPSSENKRKKRSQPGAPETIPIDHPDVQLYVNKAQQKISAESNEPNEPYIEIIEASVQVVAGRLYKIKTKLGTSDCPKGTTSNCQLQAGSEMKECLIKVWSRPWLDNGSPEITTECSSSENKRKKRSQPGAPETIPIDHPDVQLYVNKAQEKFSAESNEPNEPYIEIIEASVQVVTGRLYKIKTKLGTSDCPKGTTSNCQLQAGSEMKECLIKVWSRPWLDHGSPEITTECSSSENKRKKRSLRGTNYNNNMMRIAEDMKIERLFNVFVETYNRTYSTADEKNLRLQIFRENLGIIDLLQRNEQGTARYGVNMFADVSREEFRQRYLGLRPDLQSENEIPLPQAEIPDVDLPPTFDWRKKNVVTSVKDQGSCGSCWAFSVTGNVEGQYAIKHGQLLSLSEQELVDCDDLDDGCSGGLPDNAYRAIEKLGGLELETDYPYEAENEKCHFKRNLARVQLASAVNITSNETQMAQWLVQNGPISIGINANAMQFYMGGVSHPFKFLCNPNNLDHGVLIVGYGTSSYPLFHRKLPYWIVKNSWGKSWGEQGYYRVYRGDGTCGLNMMASSAVVV